MFEKEILLEISRKYWKNSKGYFIDVGAHFGEYSLPFCELGWSVIAFEPESENAAELSKRLSKYRELTIVLSTVSDLYDEKVEFFISKQHSGIHSLRPFHLSHTTSVLSANTRLDTYLRKRSIPSVDILKIDTEGADFLVLRGMDWINYRPFLVLAEFMDERTLPNFGYSYHEMVDFMKQSGYGCFVFDYKRFSQYGSKQTPNNPRFNLLVKYDETVSALWGNLLFYRMDIEYMVIDVVERLTAENILRKILKYPSYYLGFIPQPIKQRLISIRSLFLNY